MHLLFGRISMTPGGFIFCIAMVAVFVLIEKQKEKRKK